MASKEKMKLWISIIKLFSMYTQNVRRQCNNTKWKKKRKWHHELYINNIYSYKNQYITDSKEENEYEISKIYSNYKHIAILQVL